MKGQVTNESKVNSLAKRDNAARQKQGPDEGGIREAVVGDEPFRATHNVGRPPCGLSSVSNRISQVLARLPDQETREGAENRRGQIVPPSDEAG